MSRENEDGDLEQTTETTSDEDISLNKFQRDNSDPNDPPLVAATILPIQPDTIIDHAQAVPTVAAILMEDAEPSEQSTSDRRSSVQSTSPSILQQSLRDLSRQVSASSYTTATEEFLARQDSLPITHEVVQIDAEPSHQTEEEEQNSPNSNSTLSTQEEEAKEELEFRMKRWRRYCHIYIAASLILFVAGTIGIVIVSVNLNQSQSQELLVPAPAMPFPLSPPSPAAPSMMTTRPSISMSPSQMPSCSGLYGVYRTVNAAQSGSDHFTMNQDTIVVANFDYQLSRSFLETFHLASGTRVVSDDSYSIQDMKISGDGSRLVVGVNSYPQDELETTTGAALLVFDMVKDDKNWYLGHVILFGDDFYGAVWNVAVSENGDTMACVAETNSQQHLYVYHEAESGSMEAQGSPILASSVLPLDSNAVVELSGDGKRVFLATSDNSVRSLEFMQNDWLLDSITIGDTLNNGITPHLHPSFNGSILALGSNFDFPVQVFEDRNNMWHQVGNLDIATTSQVQHVAISGDGRNIVVGEHLTEQIVARLFRRSGSRFVQMQDISFEGVFFRGMCLDVGGERLVVAVDDTVTTYRKDCSTGN